MIDSASDLDAIADFSKALYKLDLSENCISDFARFTIAVQSGGRPDLYYSFVEDFLA
jgi:hypothetical protein